MQRFGYGNLASTVNLLSTSASRLRLLCYFMLFDVICRSQVIRMMMLNWLLMWTDVLGQILSPVLQVFGHSGDDPLLCAQVLSLDSPDDAPVLTFSGATWRLPFRLSPQEFAKDVLPRIKESGYNCISLQLVATLKLKGKSNFCPPPKKKNGTVFIWPED